MQGHRQHFLVDMLGPCMAIYIIFQLGYWAHPKVLAAILFRHNGPIHGHRQHFSAAIMGPFKVIGNISW